MSAEKNFYITTTLPYVNAEPHIGFAMEIIRADAIVRYKKLIGCEVFFNTGTDEHGAKIYKKAEEAGKDPQKYVDEYAQKFKNLIPLLGLSEDIVFTRTTDKHHVKSAQEFWKVCDKNGYIYKKNYKIKYCVGCELEKSDSELVNDCCPIHPNIPIEILDEENYFFKFSSFREKLSDFYEKNPDFVIPDFRFNEIKAFVKRGINDFSISRLKSKMPWGVEVPGDSEQVMYVWFDALVNYISAIGWPDDMKKFGKWHNKDNGMIQYCGKDNLRQQSAMWQAMLMSVGLPNSKHIIIDGFITGEGGVKMSKSLNNVIDPNSIVEEYGTDALRYFLLREMSSFEDSPFTMERFKEAYNANLANGLGNLISRIMTLAEKHLEKHPKISEELDSNEYFDFFEKFDIKLAADYVWHKISELDKYIQETEPFKIIKTDKQKGEKLISDMVVRLYEIANMLEPLIPETSSRLKGLIKENKKPEKPLFMRKD